MRHFNTSFDCWYFIQFILNLVYITGMFYWLLKNIYISITWFKSRRLKWPNVSNFHTMLMFHGRKYCFINRKSSEVKHVITNTCTSCDKKIMLSCWKTHLTQKNYQIHDKSVKQDSGPLICMICFVNRKLKMCYEIPYFPLYNWL